MQSQSIKCSWLENRISIEPDGYTRPCCGEPLESAKISKIQDGFKNAFTHSKLLELRKELLENGYTEKTDFACIRCKELESLSRKSLRTNTKFLSYNRELKGIQFKLSNKCQLACAHCGPSLSTEWAKILNIKPHVTKVEFNDSMLHELRELLPELTEIKFTGGEPFLDPTHYKILENLKDLKKDHCELIYITNGLIKPRLDLWEGWKEIKCTVSVDGYKDTYEWFRRNAKWDELCQSIDVLNKNTNMGIAVSITPWTVNSYKDVKDHFSGINVFPNNIVVPERTSLLTFPKSIAQKYFNDSYYIEMTSDTGSLDKYKKFASYWDYTWNTPNLAEKIYPWLNEI